MAEPVRVVVRLPRDEVLSFEPFDSVIEAQTVINDWKDIYNYQRPHSSHGWRTPATFANVQNALSPAASDGWFSVTRISQVFREGDLQWRIKYETLYVG